MLSPSLHEPISTALRAIGDPTPLRAARAVGGGCINHAHCVETGQGCYFLKWNAQPLPAMFLTEARGLELLHATVTVRVPTVIAASDATPEHPAFILMEWIAEERGAADQALLGQHLAALHLAAAPADYGLDHDNYIGSTPQLNGWDADWTRFFRERRLRPQVELAARNGLLPAARRRSLERLMERLGEWLDGVARRPSLLHGDLWGGNVLAGRGGAPALIDPAVAYGDREAELAYTELFGGFSPRFYQSYGAVWPLEPGYAARRDLYNIYHLLNHLNLFGESYGSQVDAIARRYGG